METEKSTDQPVIVAYKGFDSNMQCRGFQYEIGKTYQMEGPIAACERGFHACEYPLDVFSYYAPAGNTFAIVEQAGEIGRHDGDSKIASSKITVKASLDLPGIVKAAIEYTMSRCKPIDPSSSEFNSGDYGASTNSGNCGASTNSGFRGASTNSGDYGASTNSGDYGASTNSGNCGASTNSGYGGASTNSGKSGVAADFSGTGKARSTETGAIVCIARDGEGNILHIRASKVGENGIKPNIWYTLDADGNFVEAA